MIFWLIFSITLTVLYVCIQLNYIRHWSNIPTFQLKTTQQYDTKVAVIIPARNEANNIITLLNEIAQQSYDLAFVEIFVIDDDSEDDTYQLVHQFKINNININFNFNLYRLSDLCANDKIVAHKKTAIEKAIALTSAELILTTDADVIPNKNWIKTIVQFYNEKNVQAIAAPVLLYKDKNWWQQFQALDFCGMQIITAASLQAKMYNMANGANFAYTKKSFEAVNGFEGINHTASGDDMLLIYKIAKQFDGKVAYLKSLDARVKTAVQPTLRDFLQQRFRWTSKSNAYQDKRITLILITAFLFSVSIVVNHIIAICYIIKMIVYNNKQSINGLLFFYQMLLIVVLAIVQWLIKAVVDYGLLKKASHFFESKHLLKRFYLMEWYHVLYVTVVGLLGNILPYNWKGRKLK